MISVKSSSMFDVQIAVQQIKHEIQQKSMALMIAQRTVDKEHDDKSTAKNVTGLVKTSRTKRVVQRSPSRRGGSAPMFLNEKTSAEQALDALKKELLK